MLLKFYLLCMVISAAGLFVAYGTRQKELQKMILTLIVILHLLPIFSKIMPGKLVNLGDNKMLNTLHRCLRNQVVSRKFSKKPQMLYLIVVFRFF